MIAICNGTLSVYCEYLGSPGFSSELNGLVVCKQCPNDQNCNGTHIISCKVN